MFGGRKSPAVVVAGAGPAGLLGALSLVERGVTLELIGTSSSDAAKRLRRSRGSACVLHPRSLALLNRHGVTAHVLARAQLVRTLWIYSGARHLATLSFERAAQERGLPFPFAAVVPHADLVGCLREALGQRGVRVHDQRRLARIEQGAARVRIEIDHLESESAGYATAHSELAVYDSKQLEPELVLAADGHRSLARQQLELGFRELRPAERCVVFQAQARGSQPRDAVLVLGDEGSLALWPLPGDRYQGMLSVGAGPESTGELSAWPAWLAPQVVPRLGEIEERGELDVEYRVVSGWGRGRVWLAGGAAHSTSPLGYQSLNVGLCEATRLAELFAGILRGDAPLDALAVYDDERAREWQRLLLERPPPALQGVPGAQRLPLCIPAGGADLDALLEQLSLSERA